MKLINKSGYLKLTPSSPIITACLNCHTALSGKTGRGKRFCRSSCRTQWGKFNETPNTTCQQCSMPFWVFPHVLLKKTNRRTEGKFCSVKCRGKFMSGNIPLDKEGNRIGKVETSGLSKAGYIPAPEGLRTRYPSEHKRVVCEYYKTDFIPRDLHIHHRNLDKTCNELWNLAVLTGSDHRWLHTNVGDFGLKWFMVGKCTAEDIAETCNDPGRALRLLNKCILTQNLEDIDNYNP